MSTDALNADAHIFDGGPPLRLQRTIGLIKRDQLHERRRAAVAVCVAWIPLAILAIADTLLFSRPTARAFFADLSVHARYLLAIPALILAEADCIPRFERIVRQFVDSGLIDISNRANYDSAIVSTRRLLNSPVSEIVAALISYFIVIGIMFWVERAIVPSWQIGADGRVSAAGWWHIIVSLPLLLILLLGWLWRLLLWGRFLFLMSRLDLQLLPSHPDHVGGLKFVSSYLRGFRLIGFALGALVAGSLAERVIYLGAEFKSFKNLIIALIGFILVLSVGPLTVFIEKLRSTKRRGIFEYGALANHVGKVFESKWLSSTDSERAVLETPDFSATTDYYSVAANVYEMRDAPFNLKDLIGPVVPALVPFLIVALLSVPPQAVIDALIKLLM